MSVYQRCVSRTEAQGIQAVTKNHAKAETFVGMSIMTLLRILNITKKTFDSILDIDV